ncbi:MAG: helix-turn-helix domain-containing protein [Chloroflexota bacterium]
MTSLIAVGFTEYEAKIYLELLRNNPATGYQLAKQAGIPRSMVWSCRQVWGINEGGQRKRRVIEFGVGKSIIT